MVLLGILSYIMIKYRMINIVLYTILPHAIVSCDIAIFNIVLYDAVPETFYFFPIFSGVHLRSLLRSVRVHRSQTALRSAHCAFTKRSLCVHLFVQRSLIVEPIFILDLKGSPFCVSKKQNEKRKRA